MGVPVHRGQGTEKRAMMHVEIEPHRNDSERIEAGQEEERPEAVVEQSKAARERVIGRDAVGKVGHIADGARSELCLLMTPIVGMAAFPAP